MWSPYWLYRSSMNGPTLETVCANMNLWRWTRKSSSPRRGSLLGSGMVCYNQMVNHNRTLRRQELERMQTILMQRFHLDYPLCLETGQTDLYSKSVPMRALKALLDLSPQQSSSSWQLTAEEWKYLSFHVDPVSQEGIWAWQLEYEIWIKGYPWFNSKGAWTGWIGGHSLGNSG